MVKSDPPLELPVQPGVGTSALLASKYVATDEHARGDGDDDERRHHRDGGRQPHQWNTERHAYRG
jgi:hypothetical protein